jgi:hypothetical protein
MVDAVDNYGMSALHHAMVSGFEEVLMNLGISGKQIVKDFFPGFV